LCEKIFCDWKEKVNAIGHPNVEGANEYNRTIINNILLISVLLFLSQCLDACVGVCCRSLIIFCPNIITFMNTVAKELTGWTHHEASIKPAKEYSKGFRLGQRGSKRPWVVKDFFNGKMIFETQFINYWKGNYCLAS